MWLSMKQVAEKIGVHYKTLARLVREGKFAQPDGHLNGRPRWKSETIDDFMASQ